MLKNKSALVFGGSGGIGAEVTKLLAKEGAKVVVSSNRSDLDEAIVKELREAGKEAAYLSGDYTIPGFVKEVFDYAQSCFGVPDIIICSAGIGDNTTEMGNITPELMKKVFRINIAAPYMVIQEGTNRLQKADKYGKIIVLGSVCSHYTAKDGMFSVYTASKMAVNSLMESARRQICKEGNKVGYTLICPGTTNTKLVLGENGEENSMFMRPEEVAQSIVDAASLPDHVAVTDLTIISVEQDIF